MRLEIKKAISILGFLLAASFSEGSYAKFVDPAPGGQQTSVGFNLSGWSWTMAKEKIVSSFRSFFGNPSQIVIASNTVSVAAPLANSSTTGGPVPEASIVKEPLPNTSYKQASATLKSLKVPRVSVPGVPFHDKFLVMGHNNVPVFEFKKFKTQMAKAKAKRVPLLNVGTEAVLGKIGIEEMIAEPFTLVKFEQTPTLARPDLMGNSDLKIALGIRVVSAKAIEKLEIPFLEPEQKVTAEKIAKLVYKINPDASYQDLPVATFGVEDLKLLRGLILFEKRDQCHVASGIFSDLIDESEKNDVKLRSHYLLGLCLHEMNLPTEAIFHLKKVIKSGDERYLSDSIKTIVEDLPAQYESEVVEALLSLKSDLLIPENSKQDINLLKAKYFLKKGQPQKALDLALRVFPKHSKYYKAQYIASIAEYELGKLDGAIEREHNLAAELIRKGNNKDILALVQVNLGRIAFQRGKYKDSLDAFQHVPKEHPLWLQALTEQAWTQLQSKDAAGAIGNMHSIQSPYFDGVFKPEGYIVRTIGYINICQYADAFKSLAYLEHRYLPWYEKLVAYLKKDGDPYQSVATHIQTKSTAEMDGLPYQVVREAARQKDFLNLQEGINQLIDEHGGYNFVKGLIEKDKKSLLARRNATIAKVGALKLKISKARTTPGAMKDYNAWKFELNNYEEFLSVYEFKVETLKEGSEGFSRLTPVAQNRIVIEKNSLKNAAGKVLKEHFVRMEKDLKKNFENNELLKYEIYAGSGENLRYKVAGGKVGGSSASAIERHPNGEKWEFAGEFWEDEIGNYRSSLKNNCQTLTSQVSKENK